MEIEKEQDQVVCVDHSAEEPKDSDKNSENSMEMSSPQQEEESIKKKYGGMLLKKKPLISKFEKHRESQEHQTEPSNLGSVCGRILTVLLLSQRIMNVHFFYSADWALGKQGAEKPKGPLEALRPKLQPSPHHHQVRSRRSAYASADDCEVGGNNHASSEDENIISVLEMIRTLLMRIRTSMPSHQAEIIHITPIMTVPFVRIILSLIL